MTRTSALASNDLPRHDKPVVSEVTALDLPVTGRLPRELDGRYLRIGPNPLRPVDPAFRHAFVGDGMVHGIRLRDGRAEWYRNRWIRTDRVCRGLGERRTAGPRHGLCDNPNANIVWHGGRTLALGDAGVLPIELDGELGTVASSDFDGTLPNGFSAHPECDPVTGELFVVAYYHEVPHAQYLVVDPSGHVRRVERIAVHGTPMMHSLSLTDRHVMFYDLPVVFNPTLAAAGSRCPYSWQEGRPARVGVLPREGNGAAVRWFEVDPCFVFHPLNAYEEGDRIVVDLIRHERVFDRDRLRPGEATPMLWRWTVDLARGSTTEEQLNDIAEEFPRIDDRRRTVRHRYGYATAMRPGTAGMFGGSKLFKHDVALRSTEVHDFGPGREAGEAVFVPRSPLSGEDDGWLLTYVHDVATGRTDFVVLNAGDFGGAPEAVVHLPVRVPDGFHANWISEW